MFYIDLTEDLIDICTEIKKTANIIAVDTEFTKQKEYFPDLSIIQVSFFNGELIKNCIIDVLSEDINLDSFFEILNDKNIKKVFHSCSQDVEALYYISKKIPVSIEDTQIMAEFCGMKANLSYTDLIKETLGIMVKKDKKIQISDWKKRPLSTKQLEYASGDVDYLLEIYFTLAQKLDKNKNFKYYRSDVMERYGSNMITNLVRDSWRKIRFKLGNRTNTYMEAIKEMCRLREDLAIQGNVIKSLIMPDNIFKALLIEQPKNKEEMNKLFESNEEIALKDKKLKKQFIDLYFDTLEKLKKDNIEEKPYILELKNKNMLQKFEEVNDYIISICKKMNINPEAVQNKMNISSFISGSESLDELFNGWKIEVFGKRIKEIRDRN